MALLQTSQITGSGDLLLPGGEINDTGTDLNIVGTNAVTLQTSAGTAISIPGGSLNTTFAGNIIGEGTSNYMGNGTADGEATLNLVNTSAGNETMALELINDSATTGTAVGIGFQTWSASHTGKIVAKLNSLGSAKTDMFFHLHDGSNANARVTFLHSGNVGIAQDTPTEKIHIGNGGGGDYVMIQNASSGDNTSGFKINRGPSGVGMQLYDNPGDNATTLLTAGAFNLNANGGTLDFGIDTSGNATFGGIVNVSGEKIRISNSSTNAKLEIDSGGGHDCWIDLAKGSTNWTIQNTGALSFRYESNEKLKIDGSGNATFGGKVEVGTTTGMARIQVDNDADNPPYQFVNDSNSGFFRAADGQPGIAGYGVEIARFIPANNDSTYAEMALRSLRDGGQGCKIRAYTTTDSSDWAEIIFGRAGSSETNIQLRVHDYQNTLKTTTFQYTGNVYNPNNSTTWNQTSDIRIKKDINDLTGAIDTLKQIRPVSFKYKKAWTDEKGLEYGRIKNGFIADEYKDVFPNAVDADKHPVKVGSKSYDDFLSLDTEDLVPYLVKAVQELSAKVEELSDCKVLHQCACSSCIQRKKTDSV